MARCLLATLEARGTLQERGRTLNGFTCLEPGFPRATRAVALYSPLGCGANAQLPPQALGTAALVPWIKIESGGLLWGGEFLALLALLV
jgi:hypothetical protein